MSEEIEMCGEKGPSRGKKKERTWQSEWQWQFDLRRRQYSALNKVQLTVTIIG